MFKWLKQFFGFTKSRKPESSTEIIKMLPKPIFTGRDTRTIMPVKELEEAIHEDNTVVHINFNEVRKITRKFNRDKIKRKTDFYNDTGDLIID